MKQMGFPDIWCRWIWGILSSARSSVLVNRSPTFEFKYEKGMRQGDPISLFLFLLVMEALSCMLDKAKEKGILKGIGTPNNGLILSHLLYADDAIIMGEWSSENVINVVRILRVFYMCSGLKINFSKSNLFGIGTEAWEVELFATRVGCKADMLPFKYLGLTVGANMNKINSWKPVYDVFEARLSKWKADSPSIGGRLVLIKSVLESLPNYFFSLYKAPCKVIQDLEGMIRRFLWGGTNEGEKIHWVAWDNVSIPKISKLRDVNVALLTKWCWRFKEEDNNLWRRIIFALHSSARNWDFLPPRKVLGGTWNNIVKVVARTMVENTPLRSYFKAIPGRGDTISFWLDPWVSCEPLKNLFPRLFLVESNRRCMISDRLVNGLSQLEFNWRWKRSLQAGPELEDVNPLISLLSQVKLTESKDKWGWFGDGPGEFSVGNVKKKLL
ncbi:putative RNA-directed DNA polymerase [Helianthus annuus]|nr:putative RNA-directed DNA polymerase [Helianthus annuus]